MNTQDKAYLAPILQAIANIQAINLKALNLDLYYIPRSKTTPSKLADAIDAYNTNNQLDTLEYLALQALHEKLNIKIVQLDTVIAASKLPENYLTIRLTLANQDYKIILGI